MNYFRKIGKLLKDFIEKEIESRHSVDFFAVAVAGFVIFVAIAANYQNFFWKTYKIPVYDIKSFQQDKQKKEEKEIKSIQEALDSVNSSSWKEFKNDWYGFQLKYPEGWNLPKGEKASSFSSYEFRYAFRKTEDESQSDFVGFDIVIYNVSKVGSPINTEEIDRIYSNDDSENTKCLNVDGHLEENEEYPLEQVTIPFQDECFQQTLFFTVTRDNYIYNFVPVAKTDLSGEKKLERKIKKEFPEFFGAVKTFELTEISRPKPKSRSVITAPKPLAEVKIVNGRMYCAKKNDKPHKSDKDKGKHLDMECCLDPDEYPNPWCIY